MNTTVHFADLSHRQKLAELSKTAADTPMGRLLRRFWHPGALDADLPPNAQVRRRLLGEDVRFVRDADRHVRAYREASGMDGEREVPVVVYAGLLFCYLGTTPAPAFDLPRKPAFEDDGFDLYVREEIWPCNWFQQIENSLDPVHVSFVHHWGRVGSFGGAVAPTIPRLAYEETSAGVRQEATRSEKSRRFSHWTFPNNNMISTPTLAPTDPWVTIGIWMVPIDDEHTARRAVHAVPKTDAATDARIAAYFASVQDYDPSRHHDELVYGRRVPDDPLIALTSAQDYVAAMGQGIIADREHERLGTSDAGVIMLRRQFFRELEAQERGLPGKNWTRERSNLDLPRQVAE